MAAESGTQAVANGRAVSSYATGMCQMFVRDQCWKVPSLYGSAIEAWNGAAEKHPGDRTPPVGAPCYYRGGQYGHAVCFTYDQIRSTDCQTTGKVSEVDVAWIETHWGYTYLGWTGDINGVSLPLGGSENGEGMDDVGLNDPIAEWSPDDGTSKEKTTVGKTLNQARGYSEDSFQRIKSLQADVDALTKKVDKILNKLG